MHTVAAVLSARPLALTVYLETEPRWFSPVYQVARARRDVLCAVARRDARAVAAAGRRLVRALAAAEAS